MPNLDPIVVIYGITVLISLFVGIAICYTVPKEKEFFPLYTSVSFVPFFGFLLIMLIALDVLRYKGYRIRRRYGSSD